MMELSSRLTNQYNPLMEMNLNGLPVTNRKVIPADYIDIMGHMNVMWYIHIFDIATRNLFNLFDFGEDYVRRSGMGSFALESHIRYLAEIKEGQAVTVHSRVLDRSSKTVHFIHFMTRDQDGTLTATAETLGAHADLTRRVITPFPQEILRTLDPIIEQHQGLAWEAPTCGTMGVRKKGTPHSG